MWSKQLHRFNLVRTLFQQGCALIALLAWMSMTGCGKVPAPEFRFNEVEWLKQQKVHLSGDETFPDNYRREIGTLTTALFGTPDQPQFPFLEGEDTSARGIVDLERLRRAAGPVFSNRDGESYGLYRAHCAHCHGITGDGAGSTAAAVQPYPRDFRLGKFKFKSTPLRRPPTDDDLTRVIREGIPGTAMPSFRTLPNEDVAALVDYVKYLTIRGEFERRLLAELSNLDGQPLLPMPLVSALDEGQQASGDDRRVLDEQLSMAVGEWLREDILPRWQRRERHIIAVPAPPPAIDPSDPQYSQLVTTGRTLFYGKANCLQCHGDTGLGDGQQDNYDDWTNEWLKSPGVDPLNRSTFRDFLSAGALHPRPVRPRNLNVPVYRGGGQWETLYRRIAAGIEGTPMPSSPALSSDEIWAVVAYVLSMPYEPLTR
ncbi:MAG TPA: cytochrome c [Pirellulaceae bacterium]|nr:cytochrome c [Pirellulaceae bacterium]